jgi:hypothetical protein
VAIPSRSFPGARFEAGAKGRLWLPLHDTIGVEEVLGSVGYRTGFGGAGRRGFGGRQVGLARSLLLGSKLMLILLVPGTDGLSGSRRPSAVAKNVLKLKSISYLCRTRSTFQRASCRTVSPAAAVAT